MRPARPFEYRQGRLCCDDVELEEIAEAVGTPCYVYGRNAILQNYGLLRSVFRPLDPKICFAVKANSNLSVLKALAHAGSSFDIVSGGELYRLELLRVPPDRIVFSGVGKTDEELERAVTMGIHALVAESLPELERLAEISSGRGVRVSLRVNPDVEVSTHPYISTGLRRHKFGIDWSDVEEALRILEESPSLQLVGIGSHIGSQILAAEPFIAAFQKVRQLADEIRERGIALEHLDLGGGLGIPYSTEAPLDLATMVQELAALRGDYRIVLEPGRFIVGSAGVLLTRVLYRKENHGHNFFVVDAAMNDLIRPALYQAYHEILPVRQTEGSIIADMVGPVCESADFLARNRQLPEFQRGDLAAVMEAGAYGFVAASNYNSRPRCAEVLVEGQDFRTVRRRETAADLVAAELDS